MQDITEKTFVIARLGLGGLLFVFGLNGFLQFAPAPVIEGAAAQFMGGLAAAGYFFPLLKGTEMIVGLALLSGRYVPLALTVLAPITLNIVAFHAFLAPAGGAPAAVILVAHLVVAWAYRESFAGVLASSATPARAPGSVRLPLAAAA